MVVFHHPAYHNNYSSLNYKEEYDKSKQEVSESKPVSCSTISVILALSQMHV